MKLSAFVRALLLSTLLLAAFRCMADFPQPYNSEKTAGEPMPAEEAAAKWNVPTGFKVQVFAAEPDVQNPIACAWDPRGRLWIAENYTYSERALKFDPKLRDRVLIFEDLDGDGHHDKRTVFTEDVQHLTSVEVGLGGVWLMAPPLLLFVPDKDRDDKPDGPAEVVLDGFELPAENYHNFANGLRWGPDGWLYGRCGASAPGRIGAPGTPDADRVPIAGGIWRYHPQRKVFEALCHGTTNPWGSDWNEVGEMFFTNTVNGHLWHMIPGAHYARPHTIDPNPYVYELIDQHADHYHFDTGKGWQSSRDAAGGSDALGGGHAHCGAMIYLGDNWPDEYRGKLMTLNFHGRRINVERLERQGSGYVGKHEPDICFSADPFFRGIDLTYGPDGGVFILDWSDTGECHESTGVHRTSGRIYKITYDSKKAIAQGTVGVPPAGFRVSRKPPDASTVDASGETPDAAGGTPTLPKAHVSGKDLSKLSNEELVRLHEHKNEWFVRMARRVLVERVSGAGVGDLTSSDSIGRDLRIWALRQAEASKLLRGVQTAHALGACDAGFLAKIMGHTNEFVRAWIIKAAVDNLRIDDSTGRIRNATSAAGLLEIINSSDTRTREDSLVVQLALASALQRMPLTERSEALNLMRNTVAQDHNIPLMVWYGIANKPSIASYVEYCEVPITRRLIARKIAQQAEKFPAELDKILHVTAELDSPDPTLDRDIFAKVDATFQEDIINGLVKGFTGWRKAPKPAAWDAFSEKINTSSDAALVAKVRELSVLFGDGRALSEVRQVALDDKAELNARKAALQTLIDSKPDDLRATCEKLLSVRFLNSVAAKGLALFDDPAIGKKLAQSYRSFHPSERGAVLGNLLTRPAFAKALLEEVAAGKIDKSDLNAYHARQIRSLNNPELTKRLGEVWGDLRESADDKKAMMSKFKEQLTEPVLTAANKGNGRVVFETACATCHTLYGQGGQLGPDLTGSGRSNIDYLLENIVDPGAVVSADFRLSVLTLKDGRVLSGMISAKSDRTLTLKTMTEPVTVGRSEVVKSEELSQSLMPEGLVSALSEAQVRDLFAYLMYPTQVPRAETAPIK